MESCFFDSNNLDAVECLTVSKHVFEIESITQQLFFSCSDGKGPWEIWRKLWKWYRAREEGVGGGNKPPIYTCSLEQQGYENHRATSRAILSEPFLMML
jgi:hypothetical protein